MHQCGHPQISYTSLGCPQCNSGNNPQQVLELLSRIEELEKALKAARETLIYAESPLNSMGSLDKTVYWFRTKSMEWLSKYSHLLEKKESEK